MCDISLPRFAVIGVKDKMFPIFFENSKVPKWISKVAPIEVGGFSFFMFVWVRYNLTDTIRRHETIHYLQQRELFFIPYHVLYIAFHLMLLIFHRGRGSRYAYIKSPFEIESYSNQHCDSYIESRPKFAWVKYIKESFTRD